MRRVHGIAAKVAKAPPLHIYAGRGSRQLAAWGLASCCLDDRSGLWRSHSLWTLQAGKTVSSLADCRVRWFTGVHDRQIRHYTLRLDKEGGRSLPGGLPAAI